MQNEMRDRLTASIENAKKLYEGDVTDLTETEYVAECLLSEGIIVPPCKVGDVVYVPIEGTSSIFETKVLSIGVDEDGDFVLNPYEYPDDVFCVNGVNIGKTVFLTKEEAEQALKGGADNG